MIKKIHVEHLQPGMFISDFNRPWLHHPFLPARLLLRNPRDIDRMLRCGMGACQGRTCGRLIAQMISAKTGASINQVTMPTVRPPSAPVELAILAGELDEKER